MQNVRKMAEGEDIVAEVEKRIEAEQSRVLKSTGTPISRDTALAKVFREDPDLHEKWRGRSFRG